MTAYATLYLGNDSAIPLEFLQRMVPFAQISTLPPGNGAAGGYLFATPTWQMRLNAMPAPQMTPHLQQFRAWVGGDKGDPRVLERIAGTKVVYGVVAEPAFDSSGYGKRTLAAVARAGKGLIFTDQAVYDHDGVGLTGAAGAPQKLLPAELAPAQRWALAVTGITTRYFEQSHELLGGLPPGAEGKQWGTEHLADPYGIGKRSELLDFLKHLNRPPAEKHYAKVAAAVAAGSARPAGDITAEEIGFVRNFGGYVRPEGLLADDLGRAVWIAGKGYLAGYISEFEAWGWTLDAAHRLQRAYGSWEELGASYLMGITFRRGVDEELSEVYTALMQDPGSPWSTLPWETSLG
ncbi:MAG TPA: DUF1266 domain-containing protein [Polyangiaceae bacterium]|jgi:hypothetical protein